jgi:hypothetical protein
MAYDALLELTLVLGGCLGWALALLFYLKSGTGR